MNPMKAINLKRIELKRQENIDKKESQSNGNSSNEESDRSNQNVNTN
jgi:hypothetical protein